MLAKHCSLILRCTRASALAQFRSCSLTCFGKDSERDPAPLFFDPEVQEIMMSITRPSVEKILRRRHLGQKLETPVYKFMTTEEYEQAMAKAKVEALKLLQMPPIIKQREEIDKLVSYDPALQGEVTSKIAFVDISFGVKERDRLMIVREENGLLRYATWDERHRYNFIYYPEQEKELNHPKMFFGEEFENVLARNKHCFILDRACVQFDPDDPEYHRIIQAVYRDVNDKKLWESLISTRHYGPMVFYLVWNKEIEHLLLHLIEVQRIDEAALLVKLYNKIHPEAESAKVNSDDWLEIVESYAKNSSVMKNHIKLALNVYKENIAAKKQAEDEINQLQAARN